MSDPKKEFYRKSAEYTMKKMEKRGFETFYAEDKNHALKIVTEIITEDSTVSWGGSVTLNECGIIDTLNSGNYNTIDRSTAKSPEELEEVYYKAYQADYYLMSSNAITKDGSLINLDGNGNRVSSLIFGPKSVIVVAGMNKISADVDTGLKRIKEYASPVNAMRLSQNTPCSVDGKCHDCLSEDCICCELVITRKSRRKGRIKVILVGEELGY